VLVFFEADRVGEFTPIGIGEAERHAGLPASLRSMSFFSEFLPQRLCGDNNNGAFKKHTALNNFPQRQVVFKFLNFDLYGWDLRIHIHLQIKTVSFLTVKLQVNKQGLYWTFIKGISLCLRVCGDNNIGALKSTRH